MYVWRLTLLALATVVSGVVMICFIASMEWVGEPFAGFLLGRNRIVAPIGLEYWTGFRAEVPFGAQLAAVDGVPIDDVPEFVRATWDREVGTAREYTFSSPEGETRRVVEVMEFTPTDYVLLFGLWILNGPLFLGLGFVVALLKPWRPVGVATLVVGMAWGLTLLLSLGDFHRFLFRDLYAVAQAVSPAALVFFAWTFPDRSLPRRWPSIAAVFGVLTVAHAAADIFLYDRYPIAWYGFFGLSLVYMAICALASCVILARWYRRATDDGRVRLQVIAVGALAAFGVPAVVHLSAVMAGVVLPLNLLPGATGVFALAMAYAILKHDVLSIDPLLKRSVFYVVFTAAVSAGYLGLLGMASAASPGESVQAGGVSAWAPFVFTLAVVAVVEPLRRATQSLVDRFFYRTRYDLESTLEEVSRRLTGSLDRDDIAARVRGTLAETLAPQPCLLLLPAGGDEIADPSGVSIAGAAAMLPRGGSEILRAEDLAHPRWRSLVDNGVVLLVPLWVEADLGGVLAVGPKKSGAAYGTRDLTLLRTLGNQAAIALRNAASYRAVRELSDSLERRVAERTADLARTHEELLEVQSHLARADKLASLGRLVAGVAHEINNPVAFVSSSVDLIHDAASRMKAGLDGKADDDVVRALDRLLDNASICRDGAERAARIVRDLTAFSRASGGSEEPVDLNLALDRTLQLLRGETRDRIAVVRRYEEIRRPDGNPGEIDQVLMNLISNAVQAIEGEGELELRTYEEEDHVFVEVEDSGPGIPSDIQDRIFEPFFTTKKEGEGTGLGLAISQAVIARHGGDLSLVSAEGRGTTFTLRLPVRAARAAAGGGN